MDDARARLLDGLVAAIRTFQDAVDRFDAAAAARLGLNETDLRGLALLRDHGPCQPSRLAGWLGLTRGATTTVLGRLEGAGYIARADNSRDGRSHFVELTSSAHAMLDEIWRPIHAKGRDHLADYSDAQLRLLTRFMARSSQLHEACLPARPASAADQRSGLVA